MNCSHCGAETPDGARYCPECGAEQGNDGRPVGASTDKSELLAILLSFFIPGAGLVYLGDRYLGLRLFAVSAVLAAVIVLFYGYSGNGSIGIHVDGPFGILLVVAAFVVWLYSNYRARRLWEDITGCGPLI